MRFRIVLVACAAVATVSAGFATAGGGGAQKFDLWGPEGAASCDGVGNGPNSGQAGGYGFAIINAPSNGTVQATVVVKGVEPNTTLGVYLVQSNDDCGTVDGTITTNGQGKGSVHISEPSVSDYAFVRVRVTAPYYHDYVAAYYNH
jgi:hypothetical protein